MHCRFAIALVATTLLAACQSSPAPSLGSYRPLAPPPLDAAPTPPPARFSQVGVASWYGSEFHGRRTANGERFDMRTLTAAHRTLPFNAHVRVTNLATHRSVVVRINDRGPYLPDRVIDLSAQAARELGMKEHGIARVRLDVLGDETASLDEDGEWRR